MQETNGYIPAGSGDAKDLTLEVLTLKKAALLLRAINHPLLQKMLRLLHRHRGITMGGLFQTLHLEQRVAWRHLAVLNRAKFVRSERQENHFHYYVNYEELKKLQQHARALVS